MQGIIKNKLLSGIVLIALGVLLVLAPAATLEAYVRIIGCVFLLGAALHIAGHFLTKKEDRAPLSLVLGVAAALIGIFFVAAPSVVTAILPVIFGIVLILNALLDLVIAVRLPSGKAGAVVLSLIGVALGVLVLLNPNALAHILTRLIGACLIYEGVYSVGTAAIVHRTTKKK